MTTKTVCNKCGNEKICNTSRPPSVAHIVRSQGAEPAPTWLNLRINLVPAYLTQLSLDICPDCCRELRLPSTGIRPEPNSEAAIAAALADYITDSIEQEIQNCHD